jgi:putative proteasome-type protease
MTYCVAFLLEKGLVFASDSRTNAGVDYISTYSKMHVFQPAADRLFVLMAAGNLGTTQAVLNRIRRDLDHESPPPSREDGAAVPDLRSARYLFEAVDYVGQLSVAVQRQYAISLRETGATGEASFILGGQIGEERHGKPPLDYVGHPDLSLEDAARLCLVSQIVTRRSNLTVGPPFEIALVPANERRVSRRLKLEKDDSQVVRSMEIWARNMKEAIAKLPRFSWEEDPL